MGDEMKIGEAGTPGVVADAATQPLQSVEQAVGDELDFIKSLISETPPEPAKENATEEAATTPELTPEPEATGERESDETGEGEDEGGVPPEIQTKIDKRIGKEVAKTKAERERAEAAEAKARDLEARLAEVEKVQASQPEAAAGPVPLSNLTTAEQCAQMAEQARSAIGYAEDLLVRIEEDPDAVVGELGKLNVDLGPERSVGKAKAWLTRVRLNAERRLRDELPQRLRYLQNEEAANRQAEAEWSWWKEKTNPEHEIVQKIVNSPLDIKRLPHWKILVGIFVDGMKVYNERHSNAVGSKVKALPKTQPGVPVSGAPPKPSPKDGRLAKASARFLQNPNDRQAQEEYLAAIM